MSPLCQTHDCIKDMVTWALVHFVKLMSVNILFGNDCILVLFTQLPNFFVIMIEQVETIDKTRPIY